MSDLVLVTGVSGFIAKHVALRLLAEGFKVRGTVRSLKRMGDVQASFTAAGANVAHLTFAEADLGEDKGWAEAASGCRFIQHVASPFPIEQPRSREALVPAARQGTLRVLNAALGAGAERIVMTSSMVAMMYRAGRPSVMTVGEGSWTDPEWRPLSAYIVSKTRAERAAWDHMKAKGATTRLATVNPGFVLGPALDGDIGTSLEVLRLFMTGAYPAAPPVAYPVVDVRDLADLHVRAMTTQAAGGRRLIGSGETMTMQQMARALRDAFPAYARKIPAGVLPAFVIRLLALFDRRLKSVVPDLGTTPLADADYVRTLTGVSFRPSREAVIAAGQSLIDHHVV